MRKTKLFIVLAAVVALGIAAAGLAYAQNTPTPTSPNAQYQANNGFWGWLGGCLRGYNQPYSNNPYQTNAPPQTTPPQTTTPPTYIPQVPNQGYYQNGYGRGCWGW